MGIARPGHRLHLPGATRGTERPGKGLGGSLATTRTVGHKQETTGAGKARRLPSWPGRSAGHWHRLREERPILKPSQEHEQQQVSVGKKLHRRASLVKELLSDPIVAGLYPCGGSRDHDLKEKHLDRGGLGLCVWHRQRSRQDRAGLVPPLPLLSGQRSCYANGAQERITGASGNSGKESAMSPTHLVLPPALLLGSALLAQQANPPAATGSARAQIKNWIARLGHDDFAIREEATARLAEVLDDAESRDSLLAKLPCASWASAGAWQQRSRFSRLSQWSVGYHRSGW